MADAKPHSNEATAVAARDAERIYRDALEHVKADDIVRRTCTRIGDESLRLRGQIVRLPPPNHRIFVTAVGKAACSMAQGLLEVVGHGRVSGGVCIVAEGYELPCEPLEVYTCAHPIPDERCERASDRMLDFLSQLTVTDLVLFAISGGGSALLTAPPEGVPLADLVKLNEILLASGCDTEELNTVRRHVSRTKGGNLLRAAGDARVYTLILSDTLKDRPQTIASGPTVPDPTSFCDALAVLELHGLTDRAPKSVLRHLKRGAFGERRETLKKIELSERYHDPVVLANHKLVRTHAVEAAQALGYHVHELEDDLRGEAATLAEPLAARVRDILDGKGPVERPACLIGTGETTVTIRTDTPGHGGRNQHLALATARHIAGLAGVACCFAGTDGRDGPTDASGAVVTGESVDRAKAAGHPVEAALAAFDSYRVHEALGGLVKTGPTYTNLLDLAVVIVR